MKSSAQLQREAQVHRANLSDTLDQLGDSLAPNHISTELLSMLKDGGLSIARSLASSARSNPVPALLIGAGLIMMMTRSGESKDGGSGLVDKAGSALKDAISSGAAAVGDAVSGVGKAAGTVADKARSAAADALDKSGKAAQSELEKGSKLLEHGEEKAKQLAEEAERLASEGLEGLQKLAHEQPVLLAAMGAALGAALGAFLPVSAAERRYMGSMSANAVRAGRDAAVKVAEVIKTETIGDDPQIKAAAIADKVARAVTKDINKPVAN